MTQPGPLKLHPARIAYWLFVAGIGVLMWNTLRVIFAHELGWLGGSLLAGLIAVATEALFGSLLLTFHATRRPGKLAQALMLAAFSMMCNAPTLFSLMRGQALTEEKFAVQLDDALRDVSVARDGLASVAAAANRLVDYSAQTAEREATDGNTCEKSGPAKGDRYYFRQQDAARFHQDADTVNALSTQLNSLVGDIQKLVPQVGAGLRSALQQLDTELGAAQGIVQNQELVGLAGEMNNRADHDGETRTGVSGKPFHCPDTVIRDSAKRMAAQLRALPKLAQRPQVADFSDPGTAMMELPGRLVLTLSHGVGQPGALSRTDAVALLFCAALELIAIVAAGEATGDGIGRRLRALQSALAGAPAGGIEAFLRLLHDPDPALRELLALINRYRVALPPGQVVVVGHGTGDARLERLAWVMACLAAMGVAVRWRGAGSGVVRCIGWRRWPEMRGALYREAFQLKIDALDEVCLAGLLANMRAEEAGEPQRPPMLVPQLTERPLAAE